MQNMSGDFETGIVSEGPRDTMEAAATLAESLGFCGTVALSGDLGAGKTVFAKGLAEAMGVAGPVKSPSYNVCLTYEGGRGNFVHVDAYRLNGPEDFDALLIDELVPPPRLLCVEWPGVVAGALPDDAVFIEISMLAGSQKRLIRKLRGV